jgi:hypothetical protein
LGTVSVRPVLVAVAVVVTGASACVRVRPHQREHLAHPAMQTAAWPAVDRADQHVFVIREGTEGATAEGGGGCGCN